VRRRPGSRTDELGPHVLSGQTLSNVHLAPRLGHDLGHSPGCFVRRSIHMSRAFSYQPRRASDEEEDGRAEGGPTNERPRHRSLRRQTIGGCGGGLEGTA
jgi:hypothetical protein